MVVDEESSTAEVGVVDQLLHPLSTVNSESEMITTLETLQTRITQEFHPKFSSAGRRKLAFALMKRVNTVYDSTRQLLHRVLLESCGFSNTLLAAMEVISSCATSSRRQHLPKEALAMINLLLLQSEERLISVLNELVAEVGFVDVFIDTWSSQLLLFNRVIANACHAQQCPLPSWAVTSRWEARLICCAIQASESTTITKDSKPFVVRYLLALFKSVLSGPGGSGSENVAVGISHAFTCKSRRKFSCTPDVTVEVLLDPSSCFPPHQLAGLCCALVLYWQAKEPSTSPEGLPPPYLINILIPLLSSRQETQDVWVHELLLSTVSAGQSLENCVARLLMQLPINASKDPASSEDGNSDDEDNGFHPTVSPLLRQVHRISPLWADMNRHNRSQQSLTKFLLVSLGFLASQNKSTSISPSDSHVLLDALSNSDTLFTLMSGVSERLHSTNPLIRRDGMLIGQAIGQHVLHETVEFLELQHANPNERQESLAEGKNVQLPSSLNKLARRRRRETDPDAPYISESENSNSQSDDSSESVYSDDSDWGELEPLHPCNLEDDEVDLREAALPLYLQDCLDLFRTAETCDGACSAHQAALEALPRLVRERPGDLSDFGPMLARQLVCMENKFQIDDFDEKLLEPLCALVVEEPLSVGHALIEDLFRDGSLHNRVLALTALNEAAWELSENKRLRESSFALSNKDFLPLDGRRVFGKRRMVSTNYDELSIDDKTRRWGLTRDRNVPREFTNRFSDVAPTWFYALLGKFWDRVEDSTLWSGHVGSLLLAQIIQSLAIIVESSGSNSSGTQVMASDLLELVWKFRDAEVAEVRSSVLCAVGSCLTVMSEESILRLLLVGNANSVIDLPRYIQSTCSTDQDPQCRALAERLASTVSQCVNSLGT